MVLTNRFMKLSDLGKQEAVCFGQYLPFNGSITQTSRVCIGRTFSISDEGEMLFFSSCGKKRSCQSSPLSLLYLQFNAQWVTTTSPRLAKPCM